MTKVLDGVEYTKIDEDTYQGSNGHLWGEWERKEVRSKIRAAEKDMAKAVAAGLEDWNNAINYKENEAIKVEAEEDLEILDALFG
jgi:hypothetical protein